MMLHWVTFRPERLAPSMRPDILQTASMIVQELAWSPAQLHACSVR